MKRIRLIVSIIALLLIVVACKPTETEVVDQAPVISGAVDKTINRGTQFIPLQGITATDAEDGDLTGQIVYSGNVNPNVANTYSATYSVTDSAGNLTTVTVTITVVVVDTEQPLISGAGDVTILLGDSSFTILGGVTANDTIDGNLTSAIVTEGAVNVWLPGIYPVTYRVKDTSNNEAIRTRYITVNLGYFAFSNTNALVNGEFATNADGWDITGGTASVTDGILQVAMSGATTLTQTGISGGVLNAAVADYSLVKLVINAKASAATTIQAVLGGTTSSSHGISISTSFSSHTFYFRMDEVLDDEALEIILGNSGTIDIQSIALYFGVPSDDEAPVISGGSSEVIAPVSNLSALTKLMLRGVSAVDNIDGNITSRITIDTTGINLAVPGTVSIPMSVTDNAGNKTTITRTVHLNLAFDTQAIADPTFDNALDEVQWGLSGGGGEVTLYNQNGAMVVDVVSTGGWDSAHSPFLRNITTDKLAAGNWYMFKFDVKADKARQMRIRAGLELWSDPWIEDFQDGAVKNLQYQITTDWQTIYYIFYIDQAQSSAGSKVVKFEIKLGTITWGGEEANNKIYIDNAQFYLLTTQDDDPVVTNVADKQVSFGAGSTAPDWKTYVTVNDKEDGVIAVTDAMVNASAVDMNTPGTYDVIYTVSDSSGNSVTHTITITILEAADTTAPVITVNDALPVSFDQATSGSVDLLAYITAVDDVDGAITITSAMVQNGGFSLQTAGVYSVVYTVSDSSGNEATVTIILTVVDKQGPTINGAKDMLLVVGTFYNPLAGITVVDNVDGPITLTLDDITGLSAFLNLNGEITTAGVFNVTYTVEDSLGNASHKTIVITVLDVDFDDAATVDFLALQTAVQNDGGNIESVGVYNADGSLTVTYHGVKGWYGSYSKITYGSVSLIKDNVYRMLIEAKAETARDILVRFVDGASVAVPGFENRRIVRLGTDYAVIEIYFVAPATGSFNLQLQFGWEGNLVNAANANVIDIKQFEITPQASGATITPLAFVIDSFESYADQQAFNLIYMHRVPNAGANHDDAHISLGSNYGFNNSKGVKFMIGEHEVLGWDIFRTENGFTNTGLTDEHGYFAFWYKGDPSVTTIYVWLYWNGGQDSKPINVSTVPAEGGFVYLPLSLWSKTSTQILNFGIGYNHANTTFKATIYLDHFMFINDPSAIPTAEVQPVVFVLDSFNNYADQQAFDLIYMHRVPNAGANHDDAHITLGDTYGVDGTKGVKFMIGEHAVTGWDIFRTENGFNNTGLTDDLGYFAFWYKGDPSVTTIYVWLYWSGSQDSKPVDVSSVPAEGGYVYLPLSLWSKTATQITNFGIGYNVPNTTFRATIYLDNFMFIDNIDNLNA